MEVFGLSGRVALVTGAGRFTGEAIARGLAGAGASVAVNDVVPERAESVAAAIREAGGEAIAAPFDVCSGEAVAAGVKAVEAALGPVDILVNNAGVPEGMALVPFRETDEAQWQRHVDLNLYGVLHCSRAVLDGMCERGFGRIVIISSGAGQIGIGIGVSAYGAGKAGALGFMRHLSQEVAGQGVTVNALALGMMENAVPESMRAQAGATVPVGRLGRPADVAAAVRYLASEQAAWMTGQTIGLNGGAVTS